jgi:transposase InsO family protein
MDFLTVPTIGFKIIYVFFIINHDRRKIVHFNVTEHPTAQWVKQQLREAFPFDKVPKYLIFDRDSIFSSKVRRGIKNMGIKPKQTSFQSPWQNGVAERWVRSIRTELLDHVMVFNENQLRQLIREYVSYYNHDRCHLALGRDAPCYRDTQLRSAASDTVVALPRLNGLAHKYEWRNAA